MFIGKVQLHVMIGSESFSIDVVYHLPVFYSFHFNSITKGRLQYLGRHTFSVTSTLIRKKITKSW